MSTENIAKALAAFQAEMPIVSKSHTAKVAMKGGGQYSYTYADLADVTEAAMPLLSKNGLAFSAMPNMGDRGFELRGVLLHTSGESIEGALPLAGNSPQELGSSLTYMRRYLLGCLTGIVTDDDDDGRASQPAKRTAATKRAAATPPPSEEPPAYPPIDSGGHPIDAEGSAMTQRTRGRMFALFSDLGITDENEQKAGLSHVLGREVASRGSLTEGEARKVIKRLEEKKKSRQETNA